MSDLRVQRLDNGDWREISCPDTVSTAMAHARRTTANNRDHPRSRVINLATDQVLAVYEYDATLFRAKKVGP